MPVTIVGIVVGVVSTAVSANQQAKNRQAATQAANQNIVAMRESQQKEIKAAKRIARSQDISKLMAEVAKGYTQSALTATQQADFERLRRQNNLLMIGGIALAGVSVMYLITKNKKT